MRPIPLTLLIGVAVGLSISGLTPIGFGVAPHDQRAVPPLELAQSTPGHSLRVKLAHPTQLDEPAASASNYYWGNVTTTSGPQPPAKSIGGLVYDAHDQYLLWFGGYGIGGLTNQTWIYQNGSWSNLTPTLTTSPPPGMAMGMTYDASDGYVLLFGGGFSYPYSYTWKFESGRWSNITAQISGQPPARSYPGMAYDSTDGYVVMFGGWSGTADRNDTWTYHSGMWRHLVPARSPSPRLHMSMVDDRPDQSVLLVGGQNQTSVLTDTWAFSGGNWTEVNTTFPAPVASFDGLVETPDSSVLGLSCGYASPAVRCPYIYSYSAGTWTNVTPPDAVAGPPQWGRLSANPATGGVMSWGVYADSNLSETWLTLGALTVTLVATPTNTTVGQPLNISAVVAGSVPPYEFAYTGLPTGCTSANAARLVCLPTGPGNFSVAVAVIDGAGRSAAGSLLISVVPAPAIGLTSSSRAIDVNQTVRFTAAPSWNLAISSYEWTGMPPGCLGLNSSEVSCDPTAPGVYAVEVIALESTGQAIGSPPMAFEVNPLPTLTVWAAGLTGIAPLLTNLSAFESGGTPPVSLQWTFSDGFAAVGARVSHSFVNPGNYSLSVTAADSTGATATSSPFGVRVAAPMTVSIDGPSNRQASPGALWWNSTVAGGFPPYEIEWSFGDGSSGAGADSVHSYPQPGNYSVMVVAVDSEGNVADSVGQVSVLELPHGPTQSPSAASSISAQDAAVLGGLIGVVAGAAGVALAVRWRRRR